VCYGDDFLGVLTVEADAPRTFSLDDAELLRLFAAQAAVAIQNARLYEKTQRQSARLAQTLEASEWLHRGLELEQVLQRIAQGATALGFRCAVINVCDPGGERVKVRALLGIAGQERKRLTGAIYRWSDFEPLMQERFRVSRSYLVRQGQVDWEREFSEAVVIPRIEDRGPGYWRPEDALLVPLWGALGEPVGLLSVDKPVDGLLPDLDTIQTLEAFANQAAIAIENAQLYQQAQQEIAEREQAERALRQRNRELALLNRIGQELSATLDWREVIHQLLQAVTDVVSAEGASVWMWDEQQTGGLVCRDAFRREHSVALVGLRLEPGQGVAGWVAQTGESAIVPCAPEDPRFFPGIDELTGLHTISLLTVPLRVRDKVIGVLEAVNKLVGAFGVEDRALVETLAASAAVAIQNARLVEALQRRTEALQASNEELGAFGHTVAHDLRDSLHLVVGHAELLAAERATMSDQELERCVQRIAQGGRKMDNIIEALMLLAGLRDQTVERHALNMADIVTRAQERLANLVEKSQAEISLPERWPVAWGYGPWVEEVWVNYLSNALKYGGHPPRLTLGAQVLQERGGAVRFWIRDNGAGLTPEEQARLFAPFERLGRVRAQGHGLGLSIVRRIVEQLRGQVGVESEPHGSEAGSTFWFTLPGAPVISD
jgi:K+-sensing histidine kinase KdpD